MKLHLRFVSSRLWITIVHFGLNVFREIALKILQLEDLLTKKVSFYPNMPLETKRAS